MTSAKTQSPSTLSSSRVTDAMREAILTGELKPGGRLRQETLAETYNTSRIPVREALRQLESEGLITFIPNSGAWVAKLDQNECLEIYKIRECLEPLALAESCPNLSDLDLDRLEMLAKEIEAAKDIDDFLRLDREFHLVSYAGASMPNLIQMIHKYWNSTQQYRRAFALTTELQNFAAVHHEHWLIVDALKRRDGKHASMVLGGHIRRTRLQLIKRSNIFE